MSTPSLDPTALQRLTERLRRDIAAERYDGAVVLVAHDGRIHLDEALGYADRAQGIPLTRDRVFVTWSMAKAFTAVTVLQFVESGDIRLNMPVAAVLPEFGVAGKQHVTIGQLLCHTGGMSMSIPALPLELQGNLTATFAAICAGPLEGVPGETVSYSPLQGYTVLGELARRLDGGTRPLHEIMAERVFRPLAMKDTWLGMRPDLLSRAVQVVFRDRDLGVLNPAGVEALGALVLDPALKAEIPGGGAVSTAGDMFRFAEMLRQDGSLDGARILSPATVRNMTRSHTGDKPNNVWNFARQMRGWPEIPAHLGYGVFVRGRGDHPTYLGTLSSEDAFGTPGAGSGIYLVDRRRKLTFVCLTSGLMEESRSVERFQYLCDLAQCAVLDLGQG